MPLGQVTGPPFPPCLSQSALPTLHAQATQQCGLDLRKDISCFLTELTARSSCRTVSAIVRQVPLLGIFPENCRKSPRTTLRQHNRMHAPHCQACPFRTYCFSPPFPYSLNLLPPLSLSFLCSIRRCYAAQTHTKQICLSRSPPKFMP